MIPRKLADTQKAFEMMKCEELRTEGSCALVRRCNTDIIQIHTCFSYDVGFIVRDLEA